MFYAMCIVCCDHHGSLQSSLHLVMICSRWYETSLNSQHDLYMHIYDEGRSEDNEVVCSNLEIHWLVWSLSLSYRFVSPLLCPPLSCCHVSSLQTSSFAVLLELMVKVVWSWQTCFYHLLVQDFPCCVLCVHHRWGKKKLRNFKIFCLLFWGGAMVGVGFV